jgi:hypothetical protein
MKQIEKMLEYTTEQDRFSDFCLWDYTPGSPWEGKFRSINLLYHSFAVSGAHEEMVPLVEAIRDGIGHGRSVWGIKQIESKMRWEYYFYDYKRRDREVSATRLLDIMQPLVACDLKVNENLHYFMFSIDIDDDLAARNRELDEIHLYIGNPGSSVSSGICYSFTRRQPRLENFYFFFVAEKQMEDILGKIACSALIDSKAIHIDQILWPEMRSAQVIVVANKQENDAIYFSRINVDQLILFLKRMNYPKATISFIEENRSQLDHLLYDAGYDYRMEGGKLRILKSGYYGIF